MKKNNNKINDKDRVSFRSHIILISSFMFLLLFLPVFFIGCNAATGITGVQEEPRDDNRSAVSENTGDTVAATASETIIQRNVLIAASDTTFPPFEFLEDGEIVGFDIDIIYEIAARLEKEIVIEQFHWDPDFEGLLDGKYDLVISAVPYNENKESVVDFSEAYFSMKYLLISLIGSDITMREDLEGEKIGIIESGTCCITEEYMSSFEVLEYEDAMGLLEALKDREIEAILISLPIAVNLLRENKDIYYVIEEVEADRDFVMVFAKDSGLKSQFDAALKELIEDGTYESIYSKWFDYTS